jgi:hypothetical protein
MREIVTSLVAAVRRKFMVATQINTSHVSMINLLTSHLARLYLIRDCGVAH